MSEPETDKLRSFDYQSLYEAHAQRHQGPEAVGNGDFDAIGRAELEILQRQGLRPDHALLDFGCGAGRLAKYAIPFLRTGAYTGIDISPTMIERAIELCRPIQSACQVQWGVQKDECFEFADESFDMVCAFSVFTHMEHEDSFRYLKASLRIVKPGGRYVFTCLPIERQTGTGVFLASANLSLTERWGQVRNIVTSKGMMLSIAKLAGWQPLFWKYEMEGQSLCVLQKPQPVGGLFGKSLSILYRALRRLRMWIAPPGSRGERLLEPIIRTVQAHRRKWLTERDLK